MIKESRKELGNDINKNQPRWLEAYKATYLVGDLPVLSRLVTSGDLARIPDEHSNSWDSFHNIVFGEDGHKEVIFFLLYWICAYIWVMFSLVLCPLNWAIVSNESWSDIEYVPPFLERSGDLNKEQLLLIAEFFVFRTS